MVKKIVCLITLVAVMLTCFTSCKKASIDDYIAKLDDHEFTTFRNQGEINDLAREVHLEASDYKVKEIVYAHSGNSGVAIGVVIIECGSKAKAKKLAEDASPILEYMESMYNTRMYPMGIERDGKFVLIGTQQTIDSII